MEEDGSVKASLLAAPRSTGESFSVQLDDINIASSSKPNTYSAKRVTNGDYSPFDGFKSPHTSEDVLAHEATFDGGARVGFYYPTGDESKYRKEEQLGLIGARKAEVKANGTIDTPNYYKECGNEWV